MLKSTSLLGGSKAITIVVSILRNKVFALMLGPSGIGLLGTITTSVDLVRVFFLFGIDAATVKKIAQCKCDMVAASRVYKTSLRIGILLGLASTIIFFLSSFYLSDQLLNDASKYWWFIAGGSSLLLTPALSIQIAFLQGINKVREIALCQIITSISASILNILLVIAFGILGAALSISVFTVMSYVIHRIFVQKFLVDVTGDLWKTFFENLKNTIRSGSAFAINGIWLALSNWLNIFFLNQTSRSGQSAFEIGLLSAATIFGNYYLNILISAIAADFYPRLIQAADKKEKFNSLLDHQIRLCMALGIPVIAIAIITAPLMLEFFYSKEFVGAQSVMRLLLVGMSVRFVVFPLTFALSAYGNSKEIATNELLMGGITIGLSWIFISNFGLIGIGVASVCSNSIILSGLIIYNYLKKVRIKRSTLGIVYASMAFMIASTFLILNSSLVVNYIGIFALSGLILFHLMLFKKDANISLQNIIKLKKLFK
jgi:PST family polysaccharide transporter